MTQGMEEGARAATAEDLEVVLAMAGAAREGVAEARGGDMWITAMAAPLPLDEQLQAALANVDHLVTVGTLDDTVVGYAWTTARELRDGRNVAEVEELFVLPDARGVAVGEAMLKHVIAWATDRGCVAIDSTALPGDRATKNFFETFGLKARAILVHRSLADEQ